MRLFRPKKLTLYNLEHLSQCCAFTGHRPEKVVGYEGKIIVELRKKSSRLLMLDTLLSLLV